MARSALLRDHASHGYAEIAAPFSAGAVNAWARQHMQRQPELLMEVVQVCRPGNAHLRFRCPGFCNTNAAPCSLCTRRAGIVLSGPRTCIAGQKQSLRISEGHLSDTCVTRAAAVQLALFLDADAAACARALCGTLPAASAEQHGPEDARSRAAEAQAQSNAFVTDNVDAAHPAVRSHVDGRGEYAPLLDAPTALHAAACRLAVRA